MVTWTFMPLPLCNLDARTLPPHRKSNPKRNDPLPTHQAQNHLSNVWGEVLDVELRKGEVRVLELVREEKADNRHRASA